MSNGRRSCNFVNPLNLITFKISSNSRIKLNYLRCFPTFGSLWGWLNLQVYLQIFKVFGRTSSPWFLAMKYSLLWLLFDASLVMAFWYLASVKVCHLAWPWGWPLSGEVTTPLYHPWWTTHYPTSASVLFFLVTTHPQACQLCPSQLTPWGQVNIWIDSLIIIIL